MRKRFEVGPKNRGTNPLHQEEIYTYFRAKVYDHTEGRGGIASKRSAVEPKCILDER
jgi:hypothetical protein